MCLANGLLAHLAVSVSIGSTSSHQAHLSSVLPSALGTGTNRFPQCTQLVIPSMASPPRFLPPFLCVKTLERNLRSCIFIFTFDSL